ncbi:MULTISPECIES: TetR/AcrR family transcriptional regulator [unclassified Nocardioides]|uniref:TetR/AcrR family transcriptional regulator n=1 Tax=unclassified Nocardioides TaxID=2615069 RepID=UPI0006FCFAE1|nr:MULTISPECIES: TetR/AcrR family transcriptional regulator [unclassified Nocardioides]KQY54454.1 hypothetical protein ASD30_17510 [Nocardioides sp. Root140]KQZ66330.1 hypothetical protein ASD66_22590 [Nocardioides sp. Root151]KRF19530.1 hypothetical protein ASH02_23470 [Nocardioides sp. Soil796]
MSDAGSTDGRQSRWLEHKLERRGQILDAALAVIEDSPHGAEIHVSQIAARAGLSRPVIYRHFADRADLDQAVQTHILDSLRGRLTPQVVLSGSVDEIILRIVSTYVDWAAEHPNLHRVAAQDFAGVATTSPLQTAVQQIAAELSGLISLAADVLVVELDDDDRAALDPLALGLVSLAISAVQLWLARPERQPTAEVLSRLLTDTIWYAIDGHTRARGVTLDPHLPLEDLIEASWTAAR